MEPLINAISDPRGLSFLLGFLIYALFVVWRRMAIRWINWFPLVAKLARLTLYIAAIGIAVLALNVLTGSGPATESIILVLAGGAIAPILNTLVRSMRPRERVRRGARVSDHKAVNQQTAKLPAIEFKESFQVGGVKIPRSAEPYHFFVVGSTGSGKSVAITSILDHIEARGDIALVVDSGGEYASRYYKPGRDHILNPFDDRCAPWSPTAEMVGPWDAEALAKSMIPDGVGDSKEWNGYAQTLVTSVLRKLVERQQLSIKDLLYYVQAAPVTELEPLLAGTPAAAQLVSDKTFGSIRTIAANYLATYAYLSDNADPFSVAAFIRKNQSGFLFLTYRDDQLDSLRNMISCALDVAARTILALEPDKERRVWLVIDEFASIGKVQSIEALATKSRKVGGCLLIGLQSVSQLKDRYGEHAAQTILSCLSSWLVLRCSDADTSEYISKYIGETEISRMTRGESSSTTGGTDSLNEQIQTQRAVMPTELQRLANLQGFFKLSGDYPISHIKLGYPAKRSYSADNFAARDFTIKPMLDLAPKIEVVVSTDPDVAVDTGSSEGGDGGAGIEWSSLGLAPVAPKAQPEGDSASAPKPEITLKVTKTALEKGPAELEDVLNALAEGFEDSF